MQFVYLLFTLHLQNLQDYRGSEIYLPHRLEGTLQQPRAKANTPTNCDERQGTKISRKRIQANKAKTSPHYGGKIKLKDSLKYSVEIAQIQNLTSLKQNFYFVQPSWIFLLATWPTCSITWPGSEPKRDTKTQHSATIFNCSLPLTCLITRGETFLLLTSQTSLLTLPIPPFLWSERKYSKTFSIYAFGQFQLHLIESILTHFRIMSLPNSNCISTKFF